MVGGITRESRKLENNGHSDARLPLWNCSGCFGQPGDSSGRVVRLFSRRSKHGSVFLQRENKIKQKRFVSRCGAMHSLHKQSTILLFAIDGMKESKPDVEAYTKDRSLWMHE
mmetsp:Transcript_368/g.955  ORF Transcript_368/g.955 Transcript_368/m.955 type:complete len:112 (-) Transcript_368:1247-1582(-)